MAGGLGFGLVEVRYPLSLDRLEISDADVGQGNGLWAWLERAVILPRFSRPYSSSSVTVHLLYCDETNLQERRGDFLIYGGITIDSARVLDLSHRIDAIRRGAIVAHIPPTYRDQLGWVGARIDKKGTPGGD
jgi:hypothetical protein